MATAEAISLEDLKDKIFDPIKNIYVKGELDWDRYYGNYLYMNIENKSRRFQFESIEQIPIPVRVLNVIERIESIPVENITFSTWIFPKLFRYYIRYFPWLNTYKTRDGIYEDFLKLESYDDVSNNISKIIHQLSLDDTDWNKMPRSRDFPIGGLELLERWVAAGMPR